jgi:hypothetical protein
MDGFADVYGVGADINGPRHLANQVARVGTHHDSGLGTTHAKGSPIASL